MLAKVFTLVVAVFCCSSVLAEYTSYEGYKVYDIKAQSVSQQQLLHELANNEVYDFFTLPRILGLSTSVMVGPAEQAEFEATLSSAQIAYKIIEENFGATVEAERAQNNLYRNLRTKSQRDISFTAYQRFAQIDAYLDELATTYPSRVSLKTIGTSYEGRKLRTITISNGDGRANKKVILLDAGIHAREWIAPAGALYVIQQLVENFAKNAHLLKDFDWVILPVVNPDGYEYTHTKSRMWRKTRKPVTSLCSGTDANRNFDFNWGLVGASSSSCSDTFKGPTAFSEPETKALRDLMHSLTGRAKFYLTLHAQLPASWKNIDAVAQAGASAIRAATGTRYTVGSSTNVLYAAAGGSDDYALAQANIPISITMELPDGGNQFNPSPKKIQQLVSETWIGIKAMAEKVIATY